MRYIISCSLASLLSVTTAQAEVPRVVTDLPPVASLVAQVMGDLGTPVVLLDKGADAHAFQLRPSQAADLAVAQAVIWVGPQMTPWLERAVLGLPGGAVDLRLLSVPGTMVQAFAEDHAKGHAPAHDHAALAAPAAEAGHATDTDQATQAAHDDGEHGDGKHDDGDHDGLDPHAWLDPANAGLWLAAIADALAALDPANAATYATNAALAQADVARLDAELRGLLAPAQATPLVVFHNAYGYFSGHYGLNVVGAISDGDAASPGAAHLRNLQTTLAKTPAKTPACLFPEANHDAKLLATLADTTGVRIGGPLDPEGATLPDGPALYGDLMRELARAIADCAAG